MTYSCPKCGKEYAWEFQNPEYDPESITLNAKCDCGSNGEVVDGTDMPGDLLEKHKNYIAEFLFWQRASDEQKIMRLKEIEE